jgi:hypothetical protein
MGQPPIIPKAELEVTQEKLWRSPLGSKWVMGSVLTLLLLTVIKICSNPVWIAVPSNFVSPENHAKYDFLNIILYGIWVVGPPVIFLIEYTMIFGRNEDNRMNPRQCEDLKYCHELAGKIWAGVGVFLSVILLIKYGIKL